MDERKEERLHAYMQVPIAERTRAGGFSWEFAIQSMIVET